MARLNIKKTEYPDLKWNKKRNRRRDRYVRGLKGKQQALILMEQVGSHVNSRVAEITAGDSPSPSIEDM